MLESTTTNPIEKFQFIHHFLPHPYHKTRARLLSQGALLSYILTVVLLIAALKVLPGLFPGVLGYASNIKVNDLLELTNKTRKSEGLSTLRLNPSLTKAAEKKAEHMFKNDYWSHVAPDGTDPWSFILTEGYDYTYAGENLAKNFSTSDDVVDAWFKSPSHRENLMSSNYDEVGFAVVNGVLDGYETTLVVQMFGRPRNKALVVSPQEELELLDELESKHVALSPSVEEIPQVLPAVDVSLISRYLSLSFGFFLVVLLVLDLWYSKKKGIPKFTGHTFAHIIILLVVLVGVWFVMSPGVIL